MTTSNRTDVFTVAFKLHTLGFSVIPSGGGELHKSPLVSWAPYQGRQPSDADLETWQQELQPRLWGMVTGAISGVVVIDADTLEAKAELEAELGKPHVITPRGGGHFYFAYPGYHVKTVAGILPGVDIRADGGFANLVGTWPDGEYQILRLPTPDNLLPWGSLPERLRAALNGSKASAAAGKVISEIIPEGQRNATLASLAGTMRQRGMSQSAIEAALLETNALQCQPPLSDKEVMEIARSVSRYKPRPEERDKSDEQEVEQSSFLILGNCLCEQVYFDGESAFVLYDSDTRKSEIAAHVMQGEVKVIPQEGEEIALGAVKLPTGVTEYGDTLSLLEEIEAHIAKYLDISDSFRKFAAYYVLLSWVYDRFNTLPYLRFIGDTGCGKSRALDVCGGLCYKSTSASGCITPAPIYRMLRRWCGTMVLDEADLKNSDEYHEVVTILNCGFERGRPVIRAVKDNPDRLQILPTFGPKVFATRRRFKDPALEARCLTEVMQETAREDIPATLPQTFYKEEGEIRNKLLLFRFRNFHRISPTEGIELDLHGIEPRLRQISAAFGSLFAGQPEVLADYRVFITHHQRELVEQRAATLVGQVVERLFTLIESVSVVTVVTGVTAEKLLPISSHEIAEPLNMAPQAVGQMLKTLGLQIKVAKIEGKPKRCIVYDQVKLDTLKKRYIPRENEEDVTMVTPVTTVTGLNSALIKGAGASDKQRQNTREAILCIKGTGGCGLRTDPDTPFDCKYTLGNCPFLRR